MYLSDFLEGRFWFGMLKKLVYCLQVARVHILTNLDTIQVLTQSTRSLLGPSRIPRDNAKGIIKRANLFPCISKKTFLWIREVRAHTLGLTEIY